MRKQPVTRAWFFQEGPRTPSTPNAVSIRAGGATKGKFSSLNCSLKASVSAAILSESWGFGFQGTNALLQQPGAKTVQTFIFKVDLIYKAKKLNFLPLAIYANPYAWSLGC